MGIISRGRCCGRNIVFDVVTGSEPPEPDLMRLVFDDFASSGISDPSDVAEWNSVYGWSFDSVIVTDTATVELYGTNFGNEIIKESQFQFNTGILEVYDQGGFIGGMENYAFAESGIQTVYMPSLQTVPEWCFQLCLSFIEANMPSVTEIEFAGFWAASNFSTYTFGNVHTIGEVGFLATAITDATFPFCTSLGGSAFGSCTFLSTVSFPLLTNGNMATDVFNQCGSLVSSGDINLPLITQLPNRTFFQCANLATYTGTGITSVGSECFRECTGLTTANFPDAVTLQFQAFINCTSLVTYNFDSVTTAGEGAISGTSILTLELPALVTAGNEAFAGNGDCTLVDLPLCTSIGTECFGNCVDLVDINLPACVNMASNSGDCFNLISGNTIDATFNTFLQTSNGGNPDASIQDLDSNNTVTITWV